MVKKLQMGKNNLFLVGGGQNIVGVGLKNQSCADLKMEKQPTTEDATKTDAYADELVWGLREIVQTLDKDETFYISTACVDCLCSVHAIK